MTAPTRATPDFALVLAALFVGCGPTIGDDDTAGGSAGSTEGGTQTSGIEVASDDGGTCPELVPCMPFDVEITGDCRATAFVWDGVYCVEVSGCECTGPDCCHLAATREECLEAVTATCDALPFCLTCEAGTQCFALCDHVGTVLEQWCTEVTEDCGSSCVCEERGYASSYCEEAHPLAYTCVY